MGANEGGIVTTNPDDKSLLKRIGAASKDGPIMGLLLWAAALAYASIASEFTLPWPGSLVHVIDISTLVLGGCVGLGAAVYFITRFILSRELRHVLSAAAFSTLAGGIELQSLAKYHGVAAESDGWILTGAWLVSAVMFAGAAFSRTVLRGSGPMQTVGNALQVTMLVIGFPLAAIPYVVNRELVAVLADMASGSLAATMLNCLCGIVGVTLIIAALAGQYKRYQEDHDRIPAVLCIFFVPCVLALLFRTAADHRFDSLWIMSQAVSACSWLALAIGFAVANAVAQGEIQERLSELEALHDVSWSIVGAGTLRDLLDMFADALKTKLDAKIVAVYLADDTGETLEVAAARGPEGYPANIGTKYATVSANRFPGFHSGHTTKAFKTMQIQTAREVFVDVELVPWRIIATEQGAAISLPLVEQGRSIGVMSLYFGDHKQITPHRIKLLSTIAAAAAPAIENARDNEHKRTENVDAAVLDIAA
ncbi:MAG: GAF domain-containing protein [Armatimonadetes bacterium]|nr:GAF domain-containing protein [Armatimonadota bacterium]